MYNTKSVCIYIAYKEDKRKDCDNLGISIRFLIKGKEFYAFCKRDIKGASFILERIIEDKKDILAVLIMEYESCIKDIIKKLSH
ncbi:plasmid partition family protein [Borreliella carolinensis]|uniref:Plasmid partition family protein n=1 Tax=Borreliella carolinensis TaxID=478174 RepID=A0ACD5GLN6_9SPIR